MSCTSIDTHKASDISVLSDSVFQISNFISETMQRPILYRISGLQ